jgi:hypothetical protein
MIIPPTSCFYVIRAEGEAAEYITATLSTGVITDILTAVLVSTDFSNDMQASIGLDNTLTALKNQLLEPNLIRHEVHNPLYIPSSQADIDDALDGCDFETEGFRFVGMDGSPFTMKTVSISDEDHAVIEGKISCRPFELPSYSDIILGQKAEKLQ